MFRKFIRMLTPSIPLSDVPKFISYVPGASVRDVSEVTERKYGELLDRFIEFLGCNPFVEEITRQQYSDFHEWLGNRGSKPTTVNSYRRRQRAIWNRLKDRGVDVCDISGIYREQLVPFQKSKATQDKHLSQILQLATVRDAAIILYLKSSGIRRQTIPRLTIENTHIWTADNGELRIASKIPQEKTSPPRLIIGDNLAARAVQLWLDIREFSESVWLFCNTQNGGQLAVNTVSNIFTALRRSANIPAYSNVSPHGLRHRFAQKQLNEHDQKIVAQWMGISVETMLTVYAHRSDEDLLTTRLGDDSFPLELLNGSG